MKGGYVRVVLLALVAAACMAPKVTKRYDSKTLVPPDAVETPLLTVFTSEVPANSAQTTLLTLPERAQSALIKELGTKTQDADSLVKALGAPIPRPSSPNRVIDRTRVERRVVFSLENRSAQPADRIHRAQITLALPTAAETGGKEPAGATAEFRGWNQFATRFATVNLGSIKFNQTREAGLEVKAAPPQIKELTEVKGSAKAVQSLEESMNLQERFVELTGALTPSEARLIQEGAFGIDLTGNVVVDLALAAGRASDTTELDVFSFRKLDAKTPPAEVSIDRQTLRFIRLSACRPITAQATLTSVVRTTTKGDATLMEGDDHAEYRTIVSEAVRVELVSAEALQTSAWSLEDKMGTALHVALRASAPELVLLGSYDEAVALLDYLIRTNASALGGRDLSVGGKALTAELARQLQVVIQKLNWSSGACAGAGSAMK